ncbi:MAG: hypothetical protein KGL35_25005 [Bradyrhizobium sp.]|nr:hypothetical protein [Bradyrhizobium sp.]
MSTFLRRARFTLLGLLVRIALRFVPDDEITVLLAFRTLAQTLSSAGKRLPKW